MARFRIGGVYLFAVGVVAFALNSVVAQDAPAPPAPGIKGDTPRNSPAEQTQTSLQLLGSAPVRQNLNLTPEQRQKILALLISIPNDFRSFQGDGLPLIPVDASSPELKTKMALTFEKYRSQIADILTPEQTQRLKQLSYQMRGLSSVVDDDVSQALKLSDEQATKIQKLIADAQVARRDARRAPRVPGRAGRMERRNRIQNVNGDLDASIRTALTPAQLDTFAKIQGGTFDFSSIKPEASSNLNDSINLGEAEEAPSAIPKKGASPKGNDQVN